jgi:hypothetical protein
MQCKNCPNATIYYGMFGKIAGIGVNCECGDGMWHLILEYQNDYVELPTLLNDLSQIDNKNLNFCEYKEVQ